MNNSTLVCTNLTGEGRSTESKPFEITYIVLSENLNGSVGPQLGGVVDISDIKKPQKLDDKPIENYNPEATYISNLESSLEHCFNIITFEELYRLQNIKNYQYALFTKYQNHILRYFENSTNFALSKFENDELNSIKNILKSTQDQDKFKQLNNDFKEHHYDKLRSLEFDDKKLELLKDLLKNQERLFYKIVSFKNEKRNKLLFYWTCKHSSKKNVSAIIQIHPWLVDREFKIEIAKDIFVKDENKKFILNLPTCEFKTAFDQLFKDIKKELTKALAHITAINLLKPQKDPKIGYLDNIDKSLSFSNYAYSGVIKYTKDQLRAIIDSEKNTKKPKSNILIFAEVLMMATIVLYAVYLLINKLFPKKSHVEKVCEKHINNLSIFANKYSEDIKLSVPQKSYR